MRWPAGFSLDNSVRKLLPLLVLSATAIAADIAYTPPVGGMQISISPGTRFSGMSLVNAAVYRGVVTSVSGNTITLAGSGGNVGGALTTGTAYYAEFTSGPTNTYVGDRFDVDVAATQASANGSITVTLAQRGTMASVPDTASLAGYALVVRPHVTIGQLFGTKDNQLMQGSTISSSADQILLYNTANQGFDTFFFLRNSSGSTAQWRKVGGGSTNRDTEVIEPGQGFAVVRNAASAVTLTWLGEIRTNTFAQPLGAGYTLIAQPWPVGASPSQRVMNSSGGWTGSTISTQADKFLIHSNGGFSTYFFLRNSSGSTQQWRLIGGGTTSRNDEALFGADVGVMVQRVAADSNHVVPYIF